MRAITARKNTPNDLKLKNTFEGPTPYRECTDVVFLVISIAFLGGMMYVFHLSRVYGCPHRLFYGIDSWGNACNLKNKEIPNVNYSGWDTLHLTYIFTYEVQPSGPDSHTQERICVKECPRQVIRTLQELENFTAVTGSNLCRYDGSVCPSLPIAAMVPLFHRCVPVKHRSEDKVIDGLHNDVFQKIAVDLETSWKEIVYMSLLSIALSAICLIIMSYFGEYIIWFMVIAVPLTLFGLVVFGWYQYYALRRRRRDESVVEASEHLDDPALWLVITLFLTVLTVIVTLLIIALRKSISLVSQLFKEAGKVLSDIPLLILLPFLMFVITFGSLSFLVYIFISLESSGNLVVEKKTHYVYLENIQIITYMKWYHILGIFWIINFFSSCRDFMISSCVAIWYFTRSRATLKHPIFLSVTRLTRYHLGSVLLGSLLNAFLSFFRFVMAFIDSRKDNTNTVMAFLTRCLGCCLWCYEKILKFISNNAYTEMAIYGHNYCTSSKMAFYAIINNVLQLATINSAGDFFLFLGKIAVMTVCAAVGHELLMDCRDLHYTWVPMFAICIVTYVIAGCFFSVYETTIDSLFVCFCEDYIINDGQSRPYFMNKGLMSYVKNSQAKIQKPNTPVQST